MTTCSTGFGPSGFNPKGIKPLGEIGSVVVFHDSDADIGSIGAGDIFTKIQALIAAGTAYILGAGSYENTTDDKNVVTKDSTVKFGTNNPAPSFNINLDGGFCNLKDIFSAFEGDSFGIAYIPKDNKSILATEKRDPLFAVGSALGLKPFHVAIDSSFKGILNVGENANAFAAMIFHQSYEEFKFARYVELEQPGFVLKDSMLLPVCMSEVAVAGGSIVLPIEVFHGTALLADSDIEILSQPLFDTVSVTSVTQNITDEEKWDIVWTGVGRIKFRINSASGYLSGVETVVVA
jgi:hypothetical protein